MQYPHQIEETIHYDHQPKPVACQASLKVEKNQATCVLKTAKLYVPRTTLSSMGHDRSDQLLN
jgi:hypothetical protein